MTDKHEDLTQKYSSWGDKLLAHMDVLGDLQLNKQITPVNIQLAPIEMCSSDCPFCSVAGRPMKSVIPFDKIVKCLQDFRALGAKSIELTGGGEPLLYRDKAAGKTINDVIDVAFDLGYEIGIITNTNNVAGLLKEDRFHKISWLRISCIKLDEGKEPEDYNFGNFPQDRLAFSYIIYDGQTDEGGAYVADELSRTGRVYGGTTVDTIHRLAKLVSLHPNVKFVRLAGNCLIKGNNDVVQRKYKPIVDEIDKHGKFFLKEIYDNDSPFDSGCYVGGIRPYIAPNPHGGDYQVYICTSHVLQKRTYDLDYSLGSIDDIPAIWAAMTESYRKNGYPYEVKGNDGKDWRNTCNFCYYHNSNKILNTVAKAHTMPDRNFP